MKRVYVVQYFHADGSGCVPEAAFTSLKAAEKFAQGRTPELASPEGYYLICEMVVNVPGAVLERDLRGES